MPTYHAKCLNCNNEQDYRRSIDERNQTPICCEIPMQRTLDAPAGYPDIPATGQKRVWGPPAWRKSQEA